VGRMQQGWRLVKISWGVVRQQPELMVLPLTAAVAEAGIAIVYWLGVFGTKDLNTHSAAYYIALYPLLVVLTVIATFSSSVVVAVADARLRGAPISLRRALSDTVGRLPLILGWALLSATVGLVIRILQDRLPLAGRIAAFFAGAAWSLATVLVIPVLVIEGVGPITALRRSASLFRARWGEQVTGQAAIGLPLFLMSLPLLVVGLVVATQVVVLGIAIIAVTIGALIAFSGTLGGVFQTALYRYATAAPGAGPLDASAQGQAQTAPLAGGIGGFSNDDFALAFRPKRSRFS
jgi:hypothetical protein